MLTSNSYSAGSLGGALLTDLTDFSILESIFELNRAQSQGGAVYQSNSTGQLSSGIGRLLQCMWKF